MIRFEVPLPHLNLKIKLEKPKTAQKVINFRFPLEFHCKLCMSALRNCTQIFRNALRNVPRVIRGATNIVCRYLTVLSVCWDSDGITWPDSLKVPKMNFPYFFRINVQTFRDIGSRICEAKNQCAQIH